MNMLSSSVGMNARRDRATVAVVPRARVCALLVVKCGDDARNVQTGDGGLDEHEDERGHDEPASTHKMRAKRCPLSSQTHVSKTGCHDCKAGQYCAASRCRLQGSHTLKLCCDTGAEPKQVHIPATSMELFWRQTEASCIRSAVFCARGPFEGSCSHI